MTHFITSRDGKQIAYDVTGEGSLLILLHGGGHTRKNWHKMGYVARLKDYFTVAAIDIRGSGDSDKPEGVDAYAIATICDDIYQIADDCGAERFSVWGYSLGGNITRYLVARSDLIQKAVIVGIPFGPAAGGRFRQSINQFVAEWTPRIQAYQAGTLDTSKLDRKDVEEIESGVTEYGYYLLQAMLQWDDIQPSDLRFPVMTIIGTNNEPTYNSLKEMEQDIQKNNGQLLVFEGFDHPQEFSEIQQVFPPALAFLRDD